MQTAIFKNEIDNKYKFFVIFIPILVEQFFQTLIGNIDVLVISKYSDEAVAAVGLANQILTIATMILGVVGIGSIIILNQLSVSNNKEKIKSIMINSIYLNLLISIVLFIILFVYGDKILTIINMPNELIEMGYSFLRIVGFSLIFQSIMTTFASIFRSYAYVKAIMIISIVTNILNLIGNLMVIVVPMNIIGKGVIGIANSTLISRGIAAVIYIYLFFKLFKEYSKNIFKVRLEVKSIKLLFKLGLPSGMESISYNISQTILTRIIASFGTIVVSAKIYAQTITSVIFTISCAISMAVQIIVGKLIGENLKEKAKIYGVSTLYRGVSVITILSIVLIPIASVIAKFFTNDNDIISIIINLVMLSIALEPARAANSILIANLNAAGDVKFPVIVGMITTYVLTIPLSYLVAVVLGYGIYGIWIVSSIDEWIRATVFYIRWQKAKWKVIDIVS